MNIRMLSGASLAGGTSFAFRPAGLLAADATAAIFDPVDIAITGPSGDFDTEVNWTATHTDASTETGQLYWTGTGTGWVLRFNPTKTGLWTVTTEAGATALHGLSYTVNCTADDAAYGFVTNSGNKWEIQRGDGTTDLLVLNLIMANNQLQEIATDARAVTAGFTDQADAIAQRYTDLISDHSMAGVHLPNIGGLWFDVDNSNANDGTTIDTGMTNPDPLAFDALEAIINAVRAAGGVVFFWPFGDDSRNQTPDTFAGGENGTKHNRLMRYIAARLGPIPGWFMGHGFDNFEWSSPTDFGTARTYLQGKTSYPAWMGIRSTKLTPDDVIDSGDTAWTDVGDFADFEQQIDDNTTALTMLADAMSQYAGKPIMSGDRFRVRNGGAGDNNKDFTEVQTVQHMHISAMVGGIGGIYGDITDGGTTNQNLGSVDYDASTQTAMATHKTFWDAYFSADLVQDDSITAGDISCVMASDERAVGLFLNAGSGQVNLTDAALSGWDNVRVSILDIQAAYSLVEDAIYDKSSNRTITFSGTSDWLVLMESTTDAVT